jgi:uncharacterized protein involved in exopolysaccharide biosynthesis
MLNLIFKIFKKIRELKREERELLERIKSIKQTDARQNEREAQLDKREKEISLKVRTEVSAFESRILNGFRHSMESYRDRHNQLDKEEKQLNKRELELNELQQKINDQILKLGIVQGVNDVKEVDVEPK